MQKLRKRLTLAGAIVLVLAAGILSWAWLTLRASMPDYSGEIALAGLSAPVVVERDALGVATISAANTIDEARVLGFVHAQERFFQMDLMRRAAAGELSALVGQAAIATDRTRRIHRLRRTAERALAEAPAEHRHLLEAYAEGVNAGLAASGARPFEYFLLGEQPKPWAPVDSMLVVGAMYFDLQPATAPFKRSELVARQVLPEAMADLLYPRTTAWDAPLVGEPGRQPMLPSQDVFDLARLDASVLAHLHAEAPPADEPESRVAVGSNNWAIAGDRTASGAAILANDPHLGIGTPSIWFRVSLRRDTRRVTGASLPGLPALVFGSNEAVAWGLTNSYGDWSDLVILEPDPVDPDKYLTPTGSLALEEISSRIEVAGGESVPFTFEQSIFGPVIGRLPDGRRLAIRWVAHDIEGLSLDFSDLTQARDVREAMRIAQRSGVPAQNFVVADRNGNVGWTIAGPIPRRRHNERASLSSDGSAWTGWLAPDEYPSVVNPGDGLIWTANGRVVDGNMLAAIGDGNYDLGARGGQIRDRLRALDSDVEATDMLAIQLDDEALFLEHWREALLDLLKGETDPVLVAVREAVRQSADRAAVDSVGYRFVRGWRLLIVQRLTAALTAEVSAYASDWQYLSQRSEHWVWPIVESEPPHLLDPAYATWRDFKLAVLNDYVRDVLGIETADAVATRTWGEFNNVTVQHRLSPAMPILARWLDMPSQAMPGDTDMPRVQNLRFGASARFAVSPGDEAHGYFHMPGGQSGHPLSPYYGAGHEDWAEGVASPFLPGPAVDRLELVPR